MKVSGTTKSIWNRKTPVKRYQLRKGDQDEPYVETPNGVILCTRNVLLRGHEDTEQQHRDYERMINRCGRGLKQLY